MKYIITIRQRHRLFVGVVQLRQLDCPRWKGYVLICSSLSLVSFCFEKNIYLTVSNIEYGLFRWMEFVEIFKNKLTRIKEKEEVRCELLQLK